MYIVDIRVHLVELYWIPVRRGVAVGVVIRVVGTMRRAWNEKETIARMSGFSQGPPIMTCKKRAFENCHGLPAIGSPIACPLHFHRVSIRFPSGFPNKFTFQDYELSAGEASDLIAALGGASQQRAGYREPLGRWYLLIYWNALSATCQYYSHHLLCF